MNSFAGTPLADGSPDPGSPSCPKISAHPFTRSVFPTGTVFRSISSQLRGGSKLSALTIHVVDRHRRHKFRGKQFEGGRKRGMTQQDKRPETRICKAHLLRPVKISRVVHGSLLIDIVRFLRKSQISLAKMAYFNVNHWGFTGTKL